MTRRQSVPVSVLRPRNAGVSCFSVQAEAEPGVMPRVLDLFAKRGLVPSRWVSDVSGPRGRDLSIDIQARGLTPQLSAQIAQCLRQIPGVGAVLTSEKGGAATGGLHT